MTAPTGRAKEESREGERLETELQPGSGSWDPLFGAAASRRVGPWGFDLSLLYQLATEGDQDAHRGDVFSYNAAASYRIMGAEDDHGHDGQSHGEHSHMGVDLVLELNGEWRDKAEVNGQEDDNSGGNQLFLAPGVRASGQGWAASLSTGVPVVDDLNGVQVDPRWRVVGGLSVGF